MIDDNKKDLRGSREGLSPVEPNAAHTRSKPGNRPPVPTKPTLPAVDPNSQRTRLVVDESNENNLQVPSDLSSDNITVDERKGIKVSGVTTSDSYDDLVPEEGGNIKKGDGVNDRPLPEEFKLEMQRRRVYVRSDSEAEEEENDREGANSRRKLLTKRAKKGLSSGKQQTTLAPAGSSGFSLPNLGISDDSEPSTPMPLSSLPNKDFQFGARGKETDNLGASKEQLSLGNRRLRPAPEPSRTKQPYSRSKSSPSSSPKDQRVLQSFNSLQPESFQPSVPSESSLDLNRGGLLKLMAELVRGGAYTAEEIGNLSKVIEERKILINKKVATMQAVFDQVAYIYPEYTPMHLTEAEAVLRFPQHLMSIGTTLYLWSFCRAFNETAGSVPVEELGLKLILGDEQYSEDFKKFQESRSIPIEYEGGLSEIKSRIDKITLQDLKDVLERFQEKEMNGVQAGLNKEKNNTPERERFQLTQDQVLVTKDLIRIKAMGTAASIIPWSKESAYDTRVMNNLILVAGCGEDLKSCSGGAYKNIVYSIKTLTEIFGKGEVAREIGDCLEKVRAEEIGGVDHINTLEAVKVAAERAQKEFEEKKARDNPNIFTRVLRRISSVISSLLPIEDYNKRISNDKALNEIGKLLERVKEAEGANLDIYEEIPGKNNKVAQSVDQHIYENINDRSDEVSRYSRDSISLLGGHAQETSSDDIEANQDNNGAREGVQHLAGGATNRHETSDEEVWGEVENEVSMSEGLKANSDGQGKPAKLLDEPRAQPLFDTEIEKQR